MIRSIVILLFVPVLWTMCRCSVYNESAIENLEGMTVGNGIALHPKKRVLLLSRSTEIIAKNGRQHFRIFQWQYEDGAWCCEKEVPFSSDYTDYHPVFSKNGKWVYFNSDRPKPGSAHQAERKDIWRVEYNKGNWNDPEYLVDINTEFQEAYPTLTHNGTLYFTSDRPGGKGSMDIYFSKYVKRKFTVPKPARGLNSIDNENDVFVDPKERFMILNRYLLQIKEIELYISYSENSIWSQPRLLSTVNQNGTWELTPTISPDGNYLLYEVGGKISFIKMDDLLKQ